MINKSDSSYTRMIPEQIGRQEVLLPINHNHYNFRDKIKQMYSLFFCERAFNTNYPAKLEKIQCYKFVHFGKLNPHGLVLG